MGWTGIRGSRGEREDHNGLKPDGGSAIGTSLDTGYYRRTNDFADCHSATDLYSTANQHTKPNLYSSPCLAHIHPAAYGYPEAYGHASANFYASSNPYSYAPADACARYQCRARL